MGGWAGPAMAPYFRGAARDKETGAHTQTQSRVPKTLCTEGSASVSSIFITFCIFFYSNSAVFI